MKEIPPHLHTHEITLYDKELTLRPMTEQDWPFILDWNNDPEVLYFSEGDDIIARTLQDLQDIYRSVSQNALMFMIERERMPIGDCWLQAMNRSRILQRYRGQDCRRIDLEIGDKSLWGHGYGSRVIRLLTQLAFNLDVDAVFAIDVADSNPRSRRAFEKVGYQVEQVIDVPQPAKALKVYDLVIWRDTWQKQF